MKKIIYVTLALSLLIALFIGGIQGFAWHIFNTQSCQLYNIDNIELRTGVDIPKVVSTDCDCKNNTKISKFIIDTKTIDLERYISRNNFTLVDNLYIKENDNNHSTYKVVLNQNTGELTVNLTYKTND